MTGTRWRRAAALTGALVLVVGLLAGCGSGFDGLRLRIAAGNAGGVYDKLAQPLATAWQSGLGIERPQVLQTQGSPDNADRVLNGTADVAFVAADVAADKYAADKNSPRLATLARIHDDYLHIVVRADSDIRTVSQLRGRRLSIGLPASGVEYIATRLLQAADLTGAVTTFKLGLPGSVAALVRGDVDAFFWSGGLPTPTLASFNEQRTLRLLDIADLMPKMQEINQVYGTASIPASTYNQAGPVTTLLVPNFLVVSTSMPADVAEALVRGLFDARAQLAAANPAALSIDVHPGIETQPIPLHPGAVQYYRSRKT